MHHATKNTILCIAGQCSHMETRVLEGGGLMGFDIAILVSIALQKHQDSGPLSVHPINSGSRGWVCVLDYLWTKNLGLAGFNPPSDVLP